MKVCNRVFIVTVAYDLPGPRGHKTDEIIVSGRGRMRTASKAAVAWSWSIGHPCHVKSIVELSDKQIAAEKLG